MSSRRRATKSSSEAGQPGKSFESVWDAIFEDNPAVREHSRMLSELSIAIQQRIKAKGWTQKEAARQMGVTQPRISDLVRGKLDLFSIDSLAAMAGAAGIRVRLSFDPDP